MRIYYISSNNLNKLAVDTNQTLNTISSIAEINNIILISSWINKKNLAKVFNFFKIKNNFKIIKLPITINVNNFFIEKISRFIYNILALLYMTFKKKAVILTRDFSVIFFLSLIPVFLRPKHKIIFEAHKIYHKTSKKVSFSQEKKALSCADLFISNSVGTKQGLIEYFKIDEKKILVLNNGVNLDVFKKTKIDKHLLKKYEIKKDDKIIVYTGSFQDWKGVDILINVCNYLKIKNYKILLIGGYGKDLERINNLIKSYDNIKIDGYLPQDDILKILSFADIAILPNKYSEEGKQYTSPVKIFEYLAMGLPIVASKLPSIMNILKNNENCLFFKPEDSKDLADKIDLLFNNKSLIKKISINNLKLAKNFSWNKRAEKFIEFIQKNN